MKLKSLLEFFDLNKRREKAYEKRLRCNRDSYIYSLDTIILEMKWKGFNTEEIERYLRSL